VRVVGLGPGAPELLTPQVAQTLAQATDIVGYATYVQRVQPPPGAVLHVSDNRQELERAELALRLARQGRRVVVVSSGDPGVFGMAAAIFEVMACAPEWQAVPVEVLPGVTAMLAAAARVGAPLGHDFCVLNLSDNLKPWAVIEQRLRAAVAADWVMVWYNPRSRSRPDQLERALAVVRAAGASDDRWVIFARAVSTPAERIWAAPLGQVDVRPVDMSTLVFVGSSQTRPVGPYFYTPRGVLRG
jgi:precorrin-3B C17-methyltransferase